MFTKNLLLKSYADLNVVDSTNETVGVCVKISYCVMFNMRVILIHCRMSKRKERRINMHFPKHIFFLLAELVGTTDFFST